MTLCDFFFTVLLQSHCFYCFCILCYVCSEKKMTIRYQNWFCVSFLEQFIRWLNQFWWNITNIGLRVEQFWLLILCPGFAVWQYQQPQPINLDIGLFPILYLNNAWTNFKIYWLWLLILCSGFAISQYQQPQPVNLGLLNILYLYSIVQKFGFVFIPNNSSVYAQCYPNNIKEIFMWSIVVIKLQR